ncbi:MAG: molybdate ABC transporter substrate-binding protein [Gammaproteobacteria bacterium]|jgi:molybdate transport system substrate-binding protein|nr:molybdate ABC transporter substrate-binding protein [Gammaproteobacteria bacterium]
MTVIKLILRVAPGVAAGIVGVWLAVAGSQARAAELRVAVAANFAPALETLGNAFTAQTGHTLQVARGSTGKLYAQIVNGAPFDVFFAADSALPLQLEADGRATAGAGFVYAVGALVLWSPQALPLHDAPQVLRDANYRFLALANPRHAPYGVAAQQTLESLGLWESLQSRLVRGENVGQALQFVRSGNAELGFVAASQLAALDEPGGTVWVVPQALYAPVQQRVALLTDSPAARELLLFVRGEVAQKLLKAYGYTLPAK